jgi:uncharacterized membrane protein HdeD (DUF308 family)
MFVTLLYVIMGLIMLLNPQFILDAVNYIVGIFVLIYGVIYIVRFLSKNTFNTLSKFSLLAGLLCIVFGVYILLNPTLLSSIIPFASYPAKMNKRFFILTVKQIFTNFSTL